MNILLADDDLELCQLLEEYLKEEGLNVESVHDGLSAIEKLKKQTFDLVILDVMMPKLDGIETLKSLRMDSDIAIIMLTAKGEKTDRINGLELGADDYIAKPCDPRELVARIRAVTRRQSKGESNQEQDTLIVDNLTIHKLSRQVLVDESPAELTSTEYDLFIILIQAAGSLVSRELLSSMGLGKPLQMHDRSIDMHISNLRKKLGNDSQGRDRIKTVRGNGYQFVKYQET